MTSLVVAVTQQDVRGGPCTVVSLAGEADATTAELGEVLRAEVAKQPRLLVIDMSDLTFMDSASLNTIFSAYRGLKEAGGVLALVGPTANVARVLSLSGADILLPVCDSVGEASALVAAARPGDQGQDRG